MSEVNIDQPIGEPNRRDGDDRMRRLESTVDKMQDDIIYIKTRIDNGFSTSIKSTENKVNYIDERNREEHKALIESIQNLSKKFDKMLWLWLSGSLTIVIGVIVFIVKGSI